MEGSYCVLYVQPAIVLNVREFKLCITLDKSHDSFQFQNMCPHKLSHLGSVFPWKKCGFPSPIALLQSMEDVVRFQYSSRDGDYRLYGMGTSDMFMPSWVVKAQGEGLGYG